MPAEKIQTRVRYLPGQEPPQPPERPHVRVSWGVDHGDVQVASLFDSAHGAEVIISIVNEWCNAAGVPGVPAREELDRLIREKADPSSIAAQFGVGFDGFHTTLEDRHDINRMIQALKRARDGAFGRDE